MSKKLKRLSLDEFKSLSPKHLKILHEAGIITIPALANIHQVQLRNLLETTDNKARSIITQARASLPDFQVESLRVVFEREKNTEYISSGIPAIDRLLGGKGFERGSIYEAAAEFGAGKSQLAMTMAVLAAKDGGVVVLDTEGTWRATRLLQIAQMKRIDADLVLDRIRIIKPLSSGDQGSIIRSLVEEEGVKMSKILQITVPIHLLVVDSVTGLYRAEYPGRALLAQRQHLLGEHLKNLYLLGKKHNITIILTNQVIHSPDIFNPGMKAVGGNILGHACTYRMVIKKRKGLLRILEMVDSATLPVSQAPFLLGPQGILAIDGDESPPVSETEPGYMSLETPSLS